MKYHKYAAINAHLKHHLGLSGMGVRETNYRLKKGFIEILILVLDLYCINISKSEAFLEKRNDF